MELHAPLRPMNIGDLLDQAFRLYRRHFLTFIGITALLQVPLAIVQFVFQLTVGSRALSSWIQSAARLNSIGPGVNPLTLLDFSSLLTYLVFAFGLGGVQYLLVYNLITGALANAISRSYLGESITVLDAYRLGWRRYGALIGAAAVLFTLSMIALVVIFGCSFGAIGALIASDSSRGRVAAIIGVIFLLFIGALIVGILVLFLGTRLVVTTQAIVVENCGPLAGLGRSWYLVGGSFWRTLLLLTLVGILTYLIAALPATMVSFVLNAVNGGSVSTLMFNQAITVLFTQIGQLIMLPLQLIVYTLLYYDLRIRKEGYDLELKAQHIQPIAQS